MILIDYNQIALSNIIVQKLNDENMIRHMILNSIRMYNKKYRAQYGQMVICCDGMNTWRKQYFPQYKAARKYQYNIAIGYLIIENWQELNFHFNQKTLIYEPK